MQIYLIEYTNTSEQENAFYHIGDFPAIQDPGIRKNVSH